MKVSFLLLAVALLAGCARTGRYFRDAPVTRIAVAGSVFDVRVRGDLAEAVRVNPQYAPRFGPVRARAGFAMAQVSGCRVQTVLGDQALALGMLDCDGQSRARALPSSGAFSCIEVDQWLNKGPGPAHVEFDCDPV